MSGTRVFVSGLPLNITSNQLGAHFAQRSQITDAVVVPNRRIGFVGFKDDILANIAIKYFDRSYIRLSKISVVLARPIEVERTATAQAVPKSRHSGNDKVNRPVISDPNSVEKNASSDGSKTAPTSQISISNLTSKKRKRDSDVGEIGDPATLSTSGRPVFAASQAEGLKTSVSEDIHDGDAKKARKKGREEKMKLQQDTKIKELSNQVNKDHEFDKATDVSEQNHQKTTSVNDSDWLRDKTSRLLDLVDAAKPSDYSVPPEAEEQRPEPASLHQQNPPPVLAPAQPVSNASSTGRLFVRNLSYLVSEADIRNLFSKYGHCDEVQLVRDKSDKPRGIGYVRFPDHGDAERALRELDGTSFQGRLLHLLAAAEKRSPKLDDYQISKLPLKKQKALKRRAAASGSSFSWNAMYMNPDAVLSSVADRLGIAKADLIDVSSSDAAVKQAHAETHVIQETKLFFTSNGVDLQAFEHLDRDASILLVKNFPFGTTAEELTSLFGVYGNTVRCLIPPSGTIAIIQYGFASEGTQALQHLSYRNFKGSVLYLEKAPRGLFGGNGEQLLLKDDSDDVVENTQGNLVADVAEGASSTLFVRNLNFSTTSPGLADAFRPLDGFLSAKVKTKIEPRRPGEVLSMGFGFVEFRSSQQAQAACTAMDGRQLEKHKLLVQFSKKTSDAAEERRRIDNGKKAQAHKTKIILKNLPFEATKKDVRALLGAYGQLRSVKVPQKFDGSTRGFAFADFITAKEAANAMGALRDTHLLGRRLVMEFAEEEALDPEEELLAIGSKVGRQMDVIHFNRITGSGRKSFNLGTEEEQL